MEKTTREPQQKRSIQMKKRILKTAKDLICEKGFFAMTTNEIAKTANISIGSLYAYFSDKDTILLELLEQYNQHFMYVFEDIQTEVNITAYQTDTYNWLRYLLEKLIYLHQSQKDFSKELMVLYHAKPEVANIIDHQSEKVRQSILTLLEQNRHSKNPKDLEATSFVIFDVISAITDRIVFKEGNIDPERIIKEGVNMLFLYLKTLDA